MNRAFIYTATRHECAHPAKLAQLLVGGRQRVRLPRDAVREVHDGRLCGKSTIHQAAHHHMQRAFHPLQRRVRVTGVPLTAPAATDSTAFQALPRNQAILRGHAPKCFPPWPLGVRRLGLCAVAVTALSVDCTAPSQLRNILKMPKTCCQNL